MPFSRAKASSSASPAKSRSAETSKKRGGCSSWPRKPTSSTAISKTRSSRRPSSRGKEIVWARGAALAGPPYLARAAEEHSGPHMPWFWEGTLQGGGVLNDMMCHSVEEARFMLTPPGAPREVLDAGQASRHTSTA